MTALIVLPGLDGTGTLHADFLQAASASFDSARVIAYPVDLALDYAELEARVRADLPASEPFVLLGESFSGPIALAIAAHPPVNLVGLVLSTSFAKQPVPVPAFLAPLLRLAPVRHVPRALLSWFLLGRWETPQLRISLHRALHAVSPAVIRFRAATTLRVRQPDLSAIRVPVLCLRAKNDRLLSASAADYLSTSIAQCSVIDIDGPHLLLQTAPLTCAEAVAGFARKLTRNHDN